MGRKSSKHSNKQSGYPTYAGRCQQVSHGCLLCLYTRLNGLSLSLERKDIIHGIIIGCLLGTEFLLECPTLVR